MLHVLAANQMLIGLTVVAFVLASLFMILIVLVQRPQGGGLSDAFGAGSGSGSGATAFGAKTGDALTTGTIGIFVIFLALAIALNFMIRPPDNRPQAGVQGDSAPAPTTPAGTGATNEGGERITPRQIPNPMVEPPSENDDSDTGGNTGGSESEDGGP